MKKKTAIVIFLIMSILFLVFPGLVLYFMFWPIFSNIDFECLPWDQSLECLPTGDLITESTSPDGTYTIKAYVTSGNATTDFAVRGELHFNHENKEPVNIYWNYHEDYADIKWIDNDTVIINGHELDVPDETFDWREE